MSESIYVNIQETPVPGVELREGRAYGEEGGQWWPVTGLLRRGEGFVPVLEIPMREERPREEAAV